MTQQAKPKLLSSEITIVLALMFLEQIVLLSGKPSSRVLSLLRRRISRSTQTGFLSIVGWWEYYEENPVDDTLAFMRQNVGKPTCQISGTILVEEGHGGDHSGNNNVPGNSVLEHYTWYFVGTKSEVLERLKNGHDD
jgi:hypothetical protein